MAVAIRDRTTASQLAAVQSDGSVLVQPQALTKGTQSANGFSIQSLVDSGRVHRFWTVDQFASIATAEALLTVTQSLDGASTTTFTSTVITSGKRLRIGHASAFLTTTTGTAPQRCYIGIRVNTGGAATAASPLIWRGGLCNISAIAKSGIAMDWDFADGLEILGDGTKQIGISAAFPDWVTGTSVATLTLCVEAFEY